MLNLNYFWKREFRFNFDIIWFLEATDWFNPEIYLNGGWFLVKIVELLVSSLFFAVLSVFFLIVRIEYCAIKRKPKKKKKVSLSSFSSIQSWSFKYKTTRKHRFIHTWSAFWNWDHFPYIIIKTFREI
jgi:hypothetical protein